MHPGCPWGFAVQDPCSLAAIEGGVPVTSQGKNREWEMTHFCSIRPLKMKL